MGNRTRSFVLIAFVLLTVLSLPPRVRGTATYSDVFPAALSNYAYGGWQGPFGDGTAGRLFPTADGTGIYADATYNGLVWALRSSPEFSSIDMTMHFSIPNRDFTTADYFALLLILHSPTTPPSTPQGTNCDGTCSYDAGQSGFKILYRIGFNQLVITNGPGNVTLSQVSLSPVALNQPHDARATYAAGNLTVYLDSVQLVTLQTTNLPAGQIGFETYRTDLIVNTITLIGSPVPGFGLTVNPASATIAPGSSTNTTVIVGSVSGFSGTVALSATTSTSSLTASLNPSNLVLASGSNLTSTLTVDTSCFSGNETVTVAGTSGSDTRSVTFTVRSQGSCPFDFSLATTPASQTIVPGGASVVETATATLVTGVTTPVTFSITTPLPTGVTASAFTPASCSPTCSATVTLSASSTTPFETTTLTIQAVGGGVTRTATFSVVVCDCTSDFSLAASPSTLTIVLGGASGVETASATLLAGTTTPVNFAIASALPSGVTASTFTPASCSPTCSATVSLSASATAPSSSTLLTIQATGGGITHTTTFTLLVVQGCLCELSLAASPTTLTITDGAAGGVETATATLTSGTTTPVTFSILTTLPSGVTASAFSNSPCSPTCSATVTFTASATAPASSTVITIQATGGSPVVTHTTTFTLVVSGIFDFTLAASPATLSITDGAPGGVETATATLAAGATTPVTFNILTTLPSGVTASVFSNSPCSLTCSTTVTLTASANAPSSSTLITIQASGGSPAVTHTTTFTLVVSGSFDFILATTPSTLTIVGGATGGVETASATLVSGVSTAVTFSITTALPTGVTASGFTPASCSPTCFATVILTASTTAPGSTTIVTIQAVGGGVTRTATLTLSVISEQDTDGDGIFNSVDTQPTVFSNDFSDVPLGGTTYGTILSRGDQCLTLPCQLTIQEVSPSTGILITASPTGGLTPASISVCGGAAILSVNAGDALTVECGSVTVTVTAGAVQVTFVGSGSNAGIDGTATITAGNSITFEPATFSFTAPATNTTTITVTINGQTLPVAPGQTTSTPFAIFTISVINPTGQVFSAGVVTKFDGSASFATVGPITSYTWNFGDGTVLTNAASKVTHTYAVNGTYTVTLTVADKLGNSNPQSQSINVLPAPIMGSETFSRNLFVSGNRLIQNVTVQITNPNPYPILVNVRIAGNCDTVCPFSDQSGPILLTAGQTKYISVIHTFSPLDQGQTFVMQVTVTFTTDTSNMAVGTYLLASSRTFSFRIS